MAENTTEGKPGGLKEQFLTVQVSTPENIIWLGSARSVSSQSSQGAFDILPKHANFITIVKKKTVTIITKKGDKKDFKFDIAIIYNQNNKVSVYADI